MNYDDRLRLQYITQGITPDEIIPPSEAFLRGGGRWLQLRMKGAGRDEILAVGGRLRGLCSDYGAVFVVNDDPAIAAELGADGVHLGGGDMPLREARKIVGEGVVIGCTANTYDDIARLAGEGADYIGLGPYRFTTTKKGLSPVLGERGYGEILGRMKESGVDIPIVAIGGILTEDICGLKQCGVENFALSGAIFGAADAEKITREIIGEICRH